MAHSHEHRHDEHGHAHGHSHGHGHGHGHHNDRGLGAAIRYLRLLPVMWRSAVNDAVVRELAVQSGELVVDLGSGMGAATVAAARRGAKVLAVDPTPFMRTVLRVRRMRHLRRRNKISIHDGVAEKIPAADGTVDALWTVNTLHHWTDRAAAMRELARVLKPGGRVILLDEDFDDPAHPEFDHLRSQNRHARFDFDAVDPRVIAQELKSAGFAQAEGSRSRFADRPVKLVRATR